MVYYPARFMSLNVSNFVAFRPMSLFVIAKSLEKIVFFSFDRTNDLILFQASYGTPSTT